MFKRNNNWAKKREKRKKDAINSGYYVLLAKPKSEHAQFLFLISTAKDILFPHQPEYKIDNLCSQGEGNCRDLYQSQYFTI